MKALHILFRSVYTSVSTGEHLVSFIDLFQMGVALDLHNRVPRPFEKGLYKGLYIARCPSFRGSPFSGSLIISSYEL